MLFDRKFSGAGRLQQLGYVGIDNRYAAETAVEQLIQAGHRNIGAMFYFRHLSNQQERYEGYEAALNSHGLTYKEKWITFQPGEVTAKPLEDSKWLMNYRGQSQARELLRLVRDGEITAIFCATFFGAITVLNIAQEMNIVVPSLIAFDDVPELDYASLPIARVYYDLEELAKRALNKILALKDNPLDRVALAEDIIGREAERAHIKIKRGGSIKELR